LKTATNKSLIGKAFGKRFAAWTCALALLAAAAPGWAVPTVSTSTSLAASANPVLVGDPVTFTATVSGSNPGGMVTFKTDGAILGTAALAGEGDSRTAGYTATFTTAGTKNITAVYGGDALNLVSTSAVLSQGINKTSPTNTLVSSAASSVLGEPVTFTATVTGNNPTGTVTFKDGTATKGTVALSGEGNTRSASLTTSSLIAGSHSMTAVYAGNSLNSAATSDVLVQTVNKATPGIALASSANPSAAGAAVIFTATVTGNNPTGNVAFKDGTATKGTVALSGTGDTRTATFSISTLVAGSRSMTAVYAGNSLNSAATSDVLVQMVNKATSGIALASSVNPSAAGAAVSFVATVTGNNPTGDVAFKDGTATIGTVVLGGTGDTRTATFSISTLATGSRSMTAVYSGSALNSAATSDALIQAVNPAPRPTSVGLSSSLGVAPLGQSIVLTANVTGATPTGNVTFKDGAATLGTASLAAGIATFSTNALALGSHTLSADYAGDTHNDPSTSGTVMVAINNGTLTWQYGYDAMGRRTTVLDPNGLASYTYYDGLGRPIQTQQPANIGASTPTTTSFTYNARDDLTQVNDPRNLATTYSPNSVGDVTAQTSPDTGASQYTYDAVGNLLTKTDARGKLTQYAYDGLNRVTSISYPTGTASTLEYDGGATPIPAAIGKLTRITDASGETVYAYDSLGRKVSKAQTTGGKTFTVGYTWGNTGSAMDKVTAITYPSGTRVNYSYDAHGVVNAITVNPPNANGAGTNTASSLPLLSGVTTNAETQLTGWTWASTKTQAIAYDSNGRLSAYNLGDPTSTGVRRTVLRDSAGRITGYTHTSNGAPVPALDQSFAYDNLNRLTSATPGGSAVQYSYDATGNRTAKVISGTSYANAISATSNRLDQTQDTTGTATVQHDAAGNIMSDGTNTYGYSDRGRLATMTNAGGTVNYSYSALELRMSKTGPVALVPTGAAYYVYDEDGKLLGEYDANGAPVHETIYMGIPVGVIKQTGTAAASNIAISLYNVSTDQLGAPRMITRQSDEAIVWRWDTAESFGATAPDQNPASLGTFTFNQRLPGQVFDAESGLFQNWNREYNPRIGRYMQSDPIGLKGGINTFAYVEGDPLGSADPTGLITTVDMACVQNPAFCAELIGQYVKNAAAATGDQCVQDNADVVANQFRSIGTVLEVAAIVGGSVKGIVSAAKSGIESVAKKRIKYDVDAMARAAAEPDRNGLTRAGRALDKHGAGQRNNPNSPFPAPKGGPARKNEVGQAQVEDILTHPDATFTPLGRGGVGVRTPDGREIRFDADGRFAGFIE